jgi:quinoprotein glucose dehydrogenase
MTAHPVRLLRALFATLLIASAGVLRAEPSGGAGEEWPVWGGDAGATHFSRLTDITPQNVASLEVAWTHRSGDFADGSGSTRPTSFQATPLAVNGHLYYCTPFQRVFALDPETGKEVWHFDPGLKEKKGEGPYPLNCRGVTYWEDGAAVEGQACAKRIFYGTADSELISLDAGTGKPCEGFGTGGRVNLREDMGKIRTWGYYPTSPPMVMRDRVVINGFVADNLEVNSAPGVVRAFDARNGSLVWAWDPVPADWKPGPAYEPKGVYQQGAPNSWSIITGDHERGLIFVPTGNPGPDLYGGERNGIDFYGTSTVAISIETGQVAWHFQSVHHDVWDYDTPAPPTLFQIPGVGGGVPAVAQSTKMGHIFLLDRETGVPLYPVEERPVPQNGVPGETLSPTQPFPTHPKPLHNSVVTPETAAGFTPIDRWDCARKIAKLRWDGPFTPPSLEGSIGYPHTSGGMNWGGLAIDPERAIMIVNQTQMAQVNKLVPREEAKSIDRSKMQYPNELYEMEGTPYVLVRTALSSFLGAPCSPMPWGTLTAVDMKSGEVKWQIPFGTLEELARWPVTAMFTQTGAPNFGGGMATATGLYFIGASMDGYFHAFETETGKELWRTKLPFGGHSVPMSFRGKSGAQYVLISAGGNVFTRMGADLVAFRLPERP